MHEKTSPPTSPPAKHSPKNLVAGLMPWGSPFSRSLPISTPSRLKCQTRVPTDGWKKERRKRTKKCAARIPHHRNLHQQTSTNGDIKQSIHSDETHHGRTYPTYDSGLLIGALALMECAPCAPLAIVTDITLLYRIRLSTLIACVGA